jgi:hypothetical protein
MSEVWRIHIKAGFAPASDVLDYIIAHCLRHQSPGPSPTERKLLEGARTEKERFAASVDRNGDTRINAIEVDAAFTPPSQSLAALVLALCGLHAEGGGAARAAMGSRLPPVSSTFGGRDAEVKRIVGALVSPDASSGGGVVIVVAGGGLGKSQLAIACASAAHEQIAGQAMQIDCESYESAQSVLLAMLAALSVQTGDFSTTSTVSELSRALNKVAKWYLKREAACVLVVDSLENVPDGKDLEAFGAALREAVEESGGRMRFLLTSRRYVWAD